MVQKNRETDRQTDKRQKILPHDCRWRGQIQNTSKVYTSSNFQFTITIIANNPD